MRETDEEFEICIIYRKGRSFGERYCSWAPDIIEDDELIKKFEKKYDIAKEKLIRLILCAFNRE